jgi:hypothetical protein
MLRTKHEIREFRGRLVPLTRHHVIPVACHSNRWFKRRYSRQQMAASLGICRRCHGGLHQLFPDEKQLGLQFNSKERLLAHEGVQKMIAWVRRQTT